ncbi:MAG: SLC13 family permease [Planctomycetes bacterium]|nr:SLC13 family permease [Planctomycetota bacterium]
MTLAAAWSLAVLVIGLIVLIGEWLPTGVTGLLMILALAVPGTLTPEQALSGLVDPAVIAVAGMLVISAGIQRTGAIGYVANVFMGKGRNPAASYVVLLLVVLVLSAFLNNTPIVLVFLPVVLGLSGRMNEPPSRLLIPLSFVSILGGMCTLLGTSTNLVIAGALVKVSGGQHHLGMFDFTRLGVVLAAVGTVFILLFRRRLLPKRVSLALLPGKGIATEYMTEIEVPAGSRSVGRTVGEMLAFDQEAKVVRLLQLIRDEVIRPARSDTVLEAGDTLLIKGDPKAIMAARRRSGTPVETGEGSGDGEEAVRGTDQTLFEVIVAPNSSLLGRRIKNLAFGRRYDVSVFALQRRGDHHRRKVEDLRLKPGDVLLVQGSRQSIDTLKRSPDLIVVEGVHEAIPHTERAPLALLAVAVFMVLAITGAQSIAIAALIAAVVMVLSRCLTMAEASAALAWDVLLLIAGTLAVGQALSEHDVASDCAAWLAAACGPFGNHVCLLGVFAFTTCLTQILSNNAAAAIMTPLAFKTGEALPGIGPIPFVMAVAFGASCAFLTPIAYQTNLLVHGPGGYRFSDFGRLGLPLTLILMALATLLLPVMY